MDQPDQEKLKATEKDNTLKHMISWIFTNIKFLLIPGSRIEELTFREIEYEKTISKRKFIRRLKSTLTLLGIVLIFIIASFAVHAPWISPFTFFEVNDIHPELINYGPPIPGHPLGLTEFGRDVLGRMIWGARSSLTIALPSIALSVSLGIVFGVIAGYYGGWIDSIIMRICDVFLSFPYIILVMVIVAIWGQRIENIMLAYGFLGIPGYARLIRGSVLQARELPYVDAAKVAGAGNWRIMFRHILPNTIQPILISFTFDIGGIILSLAGLGFLGYSDPQMVEWGNDIANAKGRLPVAPWASFWPGFMILIAVLGFMLVGDGLRDALDPRLKSLFGGRKKKRKKEKKNKEREK